MSQPADKGNIHYFELHTCLTGNGPRQVHFLLMLLSIQKTQRIHFLKFTFCPKEASGRVLPATEYHQSSVPIHLVKSLSVSLPRREGNREGIAYYLFDIITDFPSLRVRGFKYRLFSILYRRCLHHRHHYRLSA